jgi:3-hydroxy-9,10-secoandrosta-1,3,5(10)-triene-9,17-dione monooxygenase
MSEPAPTPEELVARAAALRPRLIESQADTEERRYFSAELHEAFLEARFYDVYVPRRYGGLEYDVPTWLRIIQEIARGCPSTAWCLGLSMNHALQVASWFPESTQEAVFAGGDFRAGSVAAPVGSITPTDDGWQIDGKVAFASGSPYATYYLGQALRPSEDGREPELMLFIAPRSEWEMLDDWGDLIGLKGSGSHSIRFDGTRIPADWAIPGNMGDMPVEGGTPGSRLHGNPMYSGRAMVIFTVSLAAVMVGAVWGALDEYEQFMRTKMTAFPPVRPRISDETNQRWYGRAYTRLRTAEAAMYDCARQHMERCRANVEDGVPYTYGEDHALAGIAREVMVACWDIMNHDIWETVGASVLRDDARLVRIFRDMAIGAAHRNPQQREFFWGEIARAKLGEPRATWGY